jgi:hypothetical protein
VGKSSAAEAAVVNGRKMSVESAAVGRRVLIEALAGVFGQAEERFDPESAGCRRVENRLPVYPP